MQKTTKPIIEDELYRRIEYHLHHMSQLKEAEKAARDDAFNGGGLRLDPGVPSGTSRRSDPTAMKAVNLTDNKSRLWLEAINATYNYYDLCTNEGKLARLFYGRKINGRKVTIDDVSGQIKKSPQMLYVYRNSFVHRCAIYAAEKGLIKLSSF